MLKRGTSTLAEANPVKQWGGIWGTLVWSERPGKT